MTVNTNEEQIPPVQVPTSTIIYEVNNGLNPAPYTIRVLKDSEMEQYIITMAILGKRYSRIEKTKVRAVIYAKEMNIHLEEAFKYTWEDNT